MFILLPYRSSASFIECVRFLSDAAPLRLPALFISQCDLEMKCCIQNRIIGAEVLSSLA